MEGEINADTPMDFAAFKIWPTQNRYEAFVCHDSKIEEVASGSLDPLMLNLPEMKEFHPEEPGDSFKLQLPENLRGSAWFTKSTLSRFLHIVGSPELLKLSNAIGDEMSQLEEARKFHLALYAQPEPQTSSSDATKNELLRAMDLRLEALRKDFIVSFNRAAGATCSTKHIADLVTFSEHFGARDLRNSIFKYLAVREDQAVDSQSDQSNIPIVSTDESGKMADGVNQECSPEKTFKAVKYGASPAKVAQIERQNSSGSDESSNSSEEDRSFSERSRPLIRSGSSRRSASPMRRVQIGRSGSRRAAALTIKSLSYFPARVSSNRDAAGNSSEDEQSNLPPKKPESNVRRLSVQDAISMFESKQRDQKPDVQVKKSLKAVSANTNKAVLRRWSSGMRDSSAQCPSENGPDGAAQIAADNLDSGEMQTSSVEMNPDPGFIANSLNTNNSDKVGAFTAKGEGKTSDPVDYLTDDVDAQAEEPRERVTNSVEWSRQKEAELSQMLKMMESKPAGLRNMATGNSKSQDFPSDKKGGFYDHYKQKRDEKLRGQNSGKRAEKEEQFKALQNILDQRKAEMASKNASKGKPSSTGKPRILEKNQSPPVKPKKETSKPAVSRKPSPKGPPKASPLPATRKSWPSAPSPKANGPTPTKTPNGIPSTGTTPTRRKSQPTPSPTRSNPKMEKPELQKKSLKGTQTEMKRNLKSKEEKQQQAVSKGGKITKGKALPTTGDNATVAPTKPSFYNKVTRKGSVVPLEAKPFLRKGTGIGPGVGPAVVKTKASQSDDSLRNSENSIPVQEEVVIVSPEPVTPQKKEDVSPLVSDVTDLEPVASVNSNQNCEHTDIRDQFVAEGDSCEKATEFPTEAQSEEVTAISPNAWVEVEEHQELPVCCEINSPETAVPANVASVALSSPRVRHSLSQMLQEESGEPEIIEWGNAENPPALIYQKDAPKGLKRLLKFARKNKGESNVNGWSSPSVFSEGEEDSEEYKAASKRNADALLRKAALQAKGYGLQKTSFGDNYNGGNPEKKVMDHMATHDLLSAQSKYSDQSSQKLQEGQTSAAATSTKAARSFFSLSTFRSSKTNETKLR